MLGLVVSAHIFSNDSLITVYRMMATIVRVGQGSSNFILLYEYCAMVYIYALFPWEMIIFERWWWRDSDVVRMSQWAARKNKTENWCDQNIYFWGSAFGFKLIWGIENNKIEPHHLKMSSLPKALNIQASIKRLYGAAPGPYFFTYLSNLFWFILLSSSTRRSMNRIYKVKNYLCKSYKKKARRRRKRRN